MIKVYRVRKMKWDPRTGKKVCHSTFPTKFATQEAAKVFANHQRAYSPDAFPQFSYIVESQYIS